MHQITWVSPHALKPNPRNARTHSKKQTRQIADSVLAFGFVVPIVVDENNTILLGHGRLAAAIDLDLRTVPVIVLEGLSESKKRALLLADNKITENAGWDRKRLCIELPELTELLVAERLDISITGCPGGQQARRYLEALRASPLMRRRPQCLRPRPPDVGAERGDGVSRSPLQCAGQ